VSLGRRVALAAAVALSLWIAGSVFFTGTVLPGVGPFGSDGKHGSGGSSSSGSSSAGRSGPGKLASPQPTPDKPEVRAVLTAIDTMNDHGPYRLVITEPGHPKSYIDVESASRSHYYVTKGRTVGEEISYDGAAWIRGPKGDWTSTDGATHLPPLLTVADVAKVSEGTGGQDGAAAFRTFAVQGKRAGTPYTAVVTLWSADARLRTMQLAENGKPTVQYLFEVTKVTVQPPAR
jgi:hypothetical protein